mmetsp:Transcript_39544/g.124379  ORF Transcript_39544/g.124379 Transcript_39544/m.124379 type:complete len:312 (-) Transcript_39544:25-960(-)
MTQSGMVALHSNNQLPSIHTLCSNVAPSATTPVFNMPRENLLCDSFAGIQQPFQNASGMSNSKDVDIFKMLPSLRDNSFVPPLLANRPQTATNVQMNNLGAVDIAALLRMQIAAQTKMNEPDMRNFPNRISQTQQECDWTKIAQGQPSCNQSPVWNNNMMAPNMFKQEQVNGSTSSPQGTQSSSSSPTLEGENMVDLITRNKALKAQLEENEQKIKLCYQLVDRMTKEPTSSTQSKIETSQSRYWSEAEHKKFLEAVRCFGAHNHKAIAAYVVTRNSAQVRSHSQKFFKKLETFQGKGLPSMARKRKAVAN